MISLQPAHGDADLFPADGLLGKSEDTPSEPSATHELLGSQDDDEVGCRRQSGLRGLNCWKYSSELLAAAVLLNALAIGAEIDCDQRYGRFSPTGIAFYLVQCLLLVAFVVEFVLDLRLQGLDFFITPPEPRGTRRELCDVLCRPRLAGFFDLVVISSAICDLWVLKPILLLGTDNSLRPSTKLVSLLRLFQLLRLTRIVQVLRRSRQLMMLIQGVALSIRAVFWVFVLLFVVVYISALFCCSELAGPANEQLDAFFGSLWLSIYSHFKLMTLEQSPDILVLAMDVHALWVPYFMCFILLTNLSLMNVVTGLIIEGVIENAVEQDWIWEERLVEEKPFLEVMQAIVVSFDADRSEDLDKQEFLRLLEDDLFQEVLAVYGISLRLGPEALFDILDLHQEGRLSVKEVAHSLLKLRGSSEALHPLNLRSDLDKGTRRLFADVAETKEVLSLHYGEQVQALEERVQEHIACLASRHASTEEASAGSAAAAQSHTPQELLQLIESACSNLQALQIDLKAAESELSASLDEELALEAQLHALSTTPAANDEVQGLVAKQASDAPAERGGTDTENVSDGEDSMAGSPRAAIVSM